MRLARAHLLSLAALAAFGLLATSFAPLAEAQGRGRRGRQARRAARPTPADVYQDDDTVRMRVDASSRATRGAADAPLTLVVFAEFQDPFIVRALPTLRRVDEAYGGDVRVVFRHRPLGFHEHSRNAARAAIEALEQGGADWFWAMHDLLLQHQRALSVEDLVGYARQLGLDEQRFRSALSDGRHDAVIAADEAEATRVGATGSPTFFVNGVRIVGAQPFEAFRAVIDAELALANQAMQRGAGRADVYAIAMATALEEEPDEEPAAAVVADADADPAPVFRVPVERAHPTQGPADALVTIVTFSDFQCPFCSRVLPTLATLRQRYGNDLRIVFRHNPLPFHQNARGAAEAAAEAYAQRGDQGFWEMHDLLFANQRSLSRADLEGYAQRLGLDLGRFQAALDQHSHEPAIRDDIALAAQLGERGNPNFFINGRQLVGAQPLDRFVEEVERGLTEARALVRSGTPRRAVYARLTRNGRTTAPPPAPARAAPPRPRPDPSAVYRVPVTRDQPVRGPRDALVTIVLFTDFQCPFCGRIAPTLERVRREYGADVRIVLRNNPLPFHVHAQLAAEAAMEAFAQGGDAKFWEMHDLLFANQRALERSHLETYAQQIGLDMARFRAALDNHTHLPTIQADQQLAQQLGATGTPSSFVNGKNLRGAQPFEAFQALIDSELAAARALVRRGVPARRVYERIIRGGATSQVMLPAP